MAANTPENKVKAKVKACIKRFPRVYSNWPVPAGYGTPMLDCVGCYYGLFFAVETKAPKQKMTPRQEFCAAEMRQAGGIVFVVDGDESLKELENWLVAISIWNGGDECQAQDAGDAE